MNKTKKMQPLYTEEMVVQSRKNFVILVIAFIFAVFIVSMFLYGAIINPETPLKRKGGGVTSFTQKDLQIPLSIVLILLLTAAPYYLITFFKK